MSRKEAILAAATRLFAEHGFAHTTVAEISRLSRVAEGTVFYHFHSKEDLFLAILSQLKEDILRELDLYRDQRNPGLGIDQVEQAVSFYLYVAGKMEDQFLLLQRNYLYQLAQVNEACTEHLQAIYHCLVGIFERAIAAGHADGSIGRMSASKTALLLFTMVDGLVRFKSLHLYDPATLHGELMAACRRMLQGSRHEE
jgi:AcrR family transcriptional regulator